MADEFNVEGLSCSGHDAEVKRYDTNIGPYYRVWFEQLETMDETLKIEALQAVTELIKRDDRENARSVLNHWAKIYYVLTTDNNSNVRETAQACHGVLVQASGGLTEDLQNTFLFDWLIMCCDSHAPTAELARAQLQETFPGSKLGEAISSCKNEIINLLTYNLTGGFDNQLRMPEIKMTKFRLVFRCITKEEFYDKIRRVTLNSLKVAEYLITIIPDADVDWWWNELSDLIFSHKISELCIDKPKIIRSGTILDQEPKEIVSCIKKIYSTFTANSSLEIYALICDCIEGKIVCPFENDNNIIEKVVAESNKAPSELTKRDVVLFLHNVIFRSVILRDVLFKMFIFNKTFANTVVLHKFIAEQLNKILHDAAVLDVLYNNYYFWPDYKIIEKGKKTMDGVIENIISNLPTGTKKVLSLYFSKNATSRGYYWAYASKKFDSLYNLVTTVTYVPVERSYYSLVYNDFGNIVESIGYFHNFQAIHVKSHNTLPFVMIYSALAAHTHRSTLCNELARDWCDGHTPLNIITKAYHRNNELMLFNKYMDLSAAPWSVVVSNAVIVDFLNEEVMNRAKHILLYQWNFIFETLSSMISSLQFSFHRWTCCKVAMLTRPVLKLLGSIYWLAGSPRAEQNLVDRANALAPQFSQSLVEFATLLLDCEDLTITLRHISTINVLIESLKELRKFSKLPTSMLRPLCSSVGTALRRSTHYAHKYLAFNLLEFVSDLLVSDDAKKLQKWCQEGKETPRPEFSFNYFTNILFKLQGVLKTSLPDKESRIVPGSEAHSTALSLLLLSTHVVRQSIRSTAVADLAQLYNDLLRDGEFVNTLMTSILQILLNEELYNFVSEHCSRKFEQMYMELRLDLYRPCDGYVLGTAVCVLLYNILVSRITASDARKWILRLKPCVGDKVIDIISKQVSPMLQKHSLIELCENSKKLPVKDMSVQWSKGIIHCYVEVEDDTLDLTMKLGSKHPFEPPVFKTTCSLAPTSEFIRLFFMKKNESLLDTLKMWITTVTESLQNATQCYICYGRVHELSGRLPTEPCPQCKHLFHYHCIHKWFETSRRANCPLCRSEFIESSSFN